MNIARVLLQQAQQRPHAAALVERGDALTFGELERATARGARALELAGLRAGDRVLLLVPVSIELYVALLSLYRLGLVAVLLDPSAGRAHIDACCARAQPAALIGSPRAQLLRLASAGLRRVPRKLVSAGCWPLPGRRFRWRRASPREEIAPVRPEAPALLTFTSGSTGQPKCAVRSHEFLLAQHRALAPAIELAPGQVDLTTLPVFALANLASGVTTVLPDADLRRPGFIDPGPVLRQIDAQRITRSAASPAFFERIAARCLAEGRQLPGFERLYLGGAPVFPPTLERLQQLLPDGRVCTVYGSTEAEPISHMFWDEVSEADRARMDGGGGLLVGRPTPETRLRILPNRWGEPLAPCSEAELEAEALAADQPGEIVVSGDHVLEGYLDGQGDEETKRRVGLGVWHRTGDAGYLDGDGRLWLLGRAGARIVDARGELYPFAAEVAASAHPAVARSALIAADGKRLLAVETTGASSLAELRGALPVEIDELRELPRIPLDGRHNAKVDYPALRRALGIDA